MRFVDAFLRSIGIGKYKADTSYRGPTPYRPRTHGEGGWRDINPAEKFARPYARRRAQRQHEQAMKTLQLKRILDAASAAHLHSTGLTPKRVMRQRTVRRFVLRLSGKHLTGSTES